MLTVPGDTPLRAVMVIRLTSGAWDASDRLEPHMPWTRAARAPADKSDAEGTLRQDGSGICGGNGNAEALFR